MRKKLLSLSLLPVFIFTSCTSIPEVNHVEQEDFISALDSINSTKVYNTKSISTFVIRETFSSLWDLYEYEFDDYFCISSSEDLWSINSIMYYEIDDNSSNPDFVLDDLIESLGIAETIYYSYAYTEDWNCDIQRASCFGDPFGDSYLIYDTGYSYTYDTNIYILAYRADKNFMYITVDSESLFNTIVNSFDLPELYDNNCILEIEQRNIIIDSDNNTFSYLVFDDNKAATQFFEDCYYDVYVECCEDNDFDGFYSYNLMGERGDYSGYILLNGEFDDVQFDYSSTYLYLQEVYGGFYLKDNVVITVYTRSNSHSRIELIDDLLKELNLIIPPNK